MAYQSVGVGVWGAIYGVADHNLIECLHTQCFSINMANWPNPDGSAGQNGNGSWATPTNLGSEKFFFIEDNCIKNVTSPWAELAGNIDSTFGGRWVFRYNHCYETELQNHGTEGGIFRGCRVREIYNNDFHYFHSHNTGASRSGVTITHDNTWGGLPGEVAPKGLIMEAYRIFTWETTWGGADGTNPWDVNDAWTGSFIERGFTYNPVNGLYESGTLTSATGTTNYTLADSTKNWRAGQWVNFVIKAPNGGIAQVVSNTATSLSMSYYSDSQLQPAWAAGDYYELRRPQIVLTSQDAARAI